MTVGTTLPTLIKVLVSLLAVTYVVYFISNEYEFINALLEQFDLRLLVLSSLLVFVAYQAPYFRLKRLLHIQAQHGVSDRLYIIYMGSFFANSITPSGIGGDLYKIYKIKKDIGVVSGLYVILLERASGLIHLLIFSLTVGILSSYYFVDAAFGIYAFMVLTMVTLLPFLIIKNTHWKFGKFQQIALKICDVCSDPIVMIMNMSHYLVMLLGSLVITLNVDGSISWSLGLVIGVVFLLSSIVPASFGPWGIREITVLTVASYLGVDIVTIFSASIIFGVAILLASLPGAGCMIYEEYLRVSN